MMAARRWIAAAAALVLCSAAGAATVAIVELPGSSAQGARFRWELRADGRYELRVSRQALVSLAKDIPPGTFFESGESGDERVLVVGLAPGNGVVALSVQGSKLVVGQQAAPAPVSLTALMPAAAGGQTAAAGSAGAVPAAGPGVTAASPAAAASSGTGGGTSQARAAVEGLLQKKLKPIDGLDEFRVDMSVPTSPAFTVLGGTPELILQPKSPRDLAVSLVDNLTNKTNLGKGVGFDIAPYMLWKGRETTLSAYQQSKYLPVVANTLVSFGAMRGGSGADTVNRFALGVTMPLIDEGDPRAENSPLATCFKKAANEVLGLSDTRVPIWVLERLRVMKDGDGQANAELATELSARHDACRTQFRQLTWSATRWTIGAATSGHDRGGGTRAGTYGLWTTYSHDLTPWLRGDGAKDTDTPRSQALLHLRRMGREEVESADDARGFRLRRGTLVAAGLRYGSDRRNVSLEGSLYRARDDNGERETARKLALGGEFMINKDFWLVLSVGGEGGLRSGKSSPFAMAGIKFGSASEPTGVFAPKP